MRANTPIFLYATSILALLCAGVMMLSASNVLSQGDADTAGANEEAVSSPRIALIRYRDVFLEVMEADGQRKAVALEQELAKFDIDKRFTASIEKLKLARDREVMDSVEWTKHNMALANEQLKYADRLLTLKKDFEGRRNLLINELHTEVKMAIEDVCYARGIDLVLRDRGGDILTATELESKVRYNPVAYVMPGSVPDISDQVLEIALGSIKARQAAEAEKAKEAAEAEKKPAKTDASSNE